MDEESEFDASLKLIAKSSVVVFIAFGLSKILSYVYRIIIARQFGPEAYGLFSLAIMFSGWFTVLTVLGLNEGILRYISIFRGKKEDDKIRYLFRKSVSLLFITGLIGGILLFVLAPYISNNLFNEPDLNLFLKLFSIVVILSAMITIFLSTLRAYEKIGWRVFISFILGNTSQVVLIIVFISLGVGILSIPLSYALSTIVVFIAAILILKKKVPSVFVKTKIKGKTKIFKTVLSYSWPLIFVGIIWRIFKWTDIFVIGLFETAAEVGFYNAAIPIAFLLTFSSGLFMQMFVPLIHKEHSKKNTNVVKQLSQQVGKWVFFINLPVFVLIFLFPGALLNILFGEEFLVAANALRVLSIGMIFVSFSEVSIIILNMLGKSKTILFDVIIVSTINLVLNILLVPKYGIDGAAISTTISFVILSFLFIFQAYKETKVIPLRRKSLNIFIAIIISSALLLLLKNIFPQTILSITLLTIFFFAIYTLLVFILRGFDKNDVMIFNTFLRKFKK